MAKSKAYMAAYRAAKGGAASATGAPADMSESQLLAAVQGTRAQMDEVGECLNQLS